MQRVTGTGVGPRDRGETHREGRDDPMKTRLDEAPLDEVRIRGGTAWVGGIVGTGIGGVLVAISAPHIAAAIGGLAGVGAGSSVPVVVALVLGAGLLPWLWLRIQRRAGGKPPPLLAALALSVTLWLVESVTLLPLAGVGPFGLGVGAGEAALWLGAHAVYGLILGAIGGSMSRRVASELP